MSESENVRNAIDRIDREAGTDPTLNYLAELVREMIRESEDFAAAVANATVPDKDPAGKKTDGKTLKSAFNAMKQEASKKKSGNCYAMGDAEARKIVAEYYGVSDGPHTFAPSISGAGGSSDEDFDLFDLV